MGYLGDLIEIFDMEFRKDHVSSDSMDKPTGRVLGDSEHLVYASINEPHKLLVNEKHRETYE